jgi:DNA-binding response OmpR family regulator
MNKILIVDDQAPMVKILSDILKKENYQISIAANGQLGIKKALEINPDLIIMDIMMPVKNGIDAIKELRALDSFKTIPIIVLTAKGGLNDYQTALDAGATSFMAKPFSPGEIVEEVKKLLTDFK